MSIVQRPFSNERVRITRSLAGVGLLAALAAAGCSADVTRFDSPYFALTESGTPAPASAPSRRTDAGYAADNVPAPSNYPPPAPQQRNQGPTVAALPPLPDRGPAPAPYQPLPPPAASAPRPYAAPVAAAPQPRPAAVAGAAGKVDTIEVQQGDTLYGIARRHNVTISDLMAANDLKGSALKPGQRLHLPGSAATTGAAAPASKSPRQPLARPAPATDQTAAAAPSNWTGSYTIKAGDNLYGVARQHHVKADELQRANGITDVRKMQPGMVIKVPGETKVATAGHIASDRPTAEPARAPVAPPLPTAPTPSTAQSPAAAGVTVINGEAAAPAHRRSRPSGDARTKAGSRHR